MSNEDKIISLFNRTELRDGEDVIDNRDSVIAKELGLPCQYVSKVLSKYLDSKFNKVYDDSILKDSIKKEVNIDLNTDLEDLHIEIHKLKKQLLKHEKNEVKLKREIDLLNTQNNQINADVNKLVLCKELILQGIRTNDITTSLGYKHRGSTYKLIKRVTNMEYLDYKAKILNERTKTLR